MRFLNLVPRNRQLRLRENQIMFAKITDFIQARLTKNEERGASAVEYGLLIAGIAALIVVAVFALGPIVKEAFTDTCTSIKDGSSGTISSTCS
jgi:pilus assembly protein Flp/PilA